MPRARIIPAIESPPFDRIDEVRRAHRRRLAYELVFLALVSLALLLLAP